MIDYCHYFRYNIVVKKQPKGRAQMKIFGSTDILLPKSADMRRWAVIACDQFTSEPDYWTQVEEQVKDAPSTLRLMLPE